MLETVRTAFVGNSVVRAHVTGEMADIGRRLVEGDPTLGWEGERSLSLHLAIKQDPVTGEPTERCTKHRRPQCGSCEAEGDWPYCFEVWGIDDHNQPYLALRWPRADASLLRRLVEIDNRRSSTWERSLKIRDDAVRRREHAQAERRGEMVERLAHAVQKDLGHRVGGLTKRIH